MFQYRYHVIAGFLAVAVLIGGMTQASHAEQYKVLVVMSYEEQYSWVKDIKEGIDDVLAGNSTIEYFYMNTKTHPESGAQKAEEAYARYQEFQPDGVIVADDNGQSMFVLPFLKDQVETPVMFCGVNAEPEKYGYPASNVSGILERHLIEESLTFAQQLVPTIHHVLVMAKAGPTGETMLEQLRRDAEDYPVTFVNFELANTLQEAVALVEAAREKVDALFVETLEGLLDDHGKALSQKESLPVLNEHFGKPIITNGVERVNYGALCAVSISGQEHGHTAAEMLLQAMQGTDISELPVTRNKFGRKVLNVDTMGALGIKPSPALLRGTELVKTEQ